MMKAGAVRRVIICMAAVGLAASLAGCDRSGPAVHNDLDAMAQADLSIDEHRFRVWVAADGPQTERGLMGITQEQMAPLPDGTERGMIFLFAGPRRSPFWMKNTIIPLDIAFIRADGTIVSLQTMAPLDTRGYYPKGPYRYALEVRANLFSKLRISGGDRVQIPESLLKQAR